MITGMDQAQRHYDNEQHPDYYEPDDLAKQEMEKDLSDERDVRNDWK